MLLYANQTQNNSIAPNVNLSGSLEAIEKFAYIDATANLSTSFLSPFGPQPANLVNATSNRYTSQTYTVSPYIKGVLGSTNISYQVRDDNYWTASSSFGDSSSKVPNTYGNNLSASMSLRDKPRGVAPRIQPLLLRQRHPGRWRRQPRRPRQLHVAGCARHRVAPGRSAVAAVRENRL